MLTPDCIEGFMPGWLGLHPATCVGQAVTCGCQQLMLCSTALVPCSGKVALVTFTPCWCGIGLHAYPEP